MALTVGSDLVYFDFIGSEAIGTWSTLAKRRWGAQPKLWSFKTEASEATINTADFFLVAIDILNVGDRIFVVEVTNRGSSSESFTASRWHYVSAKTANSITISTISGTGGAVDSVFGRTGTVVAASGDYAASEVTNDSSVSGTGVSGALDTLDGAKQDVLSEGAFEDGDKTKIDGLGARLTGTGTIPSSVSAGQTATFTCTVTGAVVADKVLAVVLPAAAAADTSLVVTSARVTGNDTVTVWLANTSPQDIGSLTGSATATVEVS